MLSSQLHMLQTETVSNPVEGDISPEQISSSYCEEKTGPGIHKSELSQNTVEDITQDKSLSDDTESVPLSFSLQLSQIDFKDGGETDLQTKVNELLDTNKNLEKSLKHARKRCRELLKDLREEREKKILRGDDFKMIHKILNKYI